MRVPSDIRQTRLTGLAYLGIILCGVFAEGVARDGLMIDGDASATAQALQSQLGLFRASILADLAMLACDGLVAVLFFRLLRPHGPVLAKIALGLRLLQAATILWGVTFLMRIFPALQGGDDRAIYAALHAHGLIYDIGLIFFAGNCWAMAVLLHRAGGVPRLICNGIGVSGVVYLLGSLTHLIAAPWLGLIAPAYLIPLLAETALSLWLLITARITARL